MRNKKLKMKNYGVIILLITALLGFGIWDLGFAADLTDPMSIGVGARSMGMGKAYAGLAEDGDALFLNPAGIARNPNIKISSMYTNLLNDVTYTVLGGVYPHSEYSAFGAGYVGSTSGDIILRSAAGTQEGTAAWGSNVLFVSYSTYLKEFLPQMESIRDVLVGTSLKYYSAGASGGTSSSDSGYGLDLGVLVPLSSYANLGINAQNVLASTMSQSGDSIPYCYKIGTKVALIGQKGEALMDHKNRTLNLVLDANLQRNINTGHVGLELWPTRNFALRLGSDAGDLTAGLGVRFFGVEFDYAYHPYSNIPENATHYFSLCYLGEVTPRMLRVKLDSPADKAVVYEDFVRVSGKVEVTGGEEEGEEETPVTLKINEVNVPVAKDLSFDVDVPVEKFGKNLLNINAEAGLAKEAQEIRLVRLTSFADVPEGYWAKQPIENTSTVGLINGYPDKSFRPDGELTRAELATLMIRAKGIEVKGGAKKVFKDVPADFWAARYIEEAKRMGLIKGYKTKKGYVFRPNNKLQMAEAVAILARFDNLPLQYVSARPFSDVPVDHWSARYIDAAKKAGMLSHLPEGRLGPKNNITRAEAVKMLSQTSVAGSLIKDLYSWEKGFKRELFYRPKIKAEEGTETEILAQK